VELQRNKYSLVILHLVVLMIYKKYIV